MPRKYQIKTMKEDIEKLRKKVVISEPIATVKKEPGEPLPSEPMIGQLAKPAERSKPIIKKEKKETLPVIFVIIFLLAGSGFFYWWNYLRAPEKSQPEIPFSLIRVEISEVLAIREGQGTELFEKLKQKANAFQEESTFRRILVKKVTPEKDYFLSFKKVLEVLGTTIPAGIFETLKEENTLFLYAQEQGSRLGFMVEVSDIDKLVEYLGPWEETMISDLKPVFLDEEIGEPFAEGFQDNVYQNVNIRYLNFPESSLTIDYALVGDYLIITTSKESMHRAIDRILE